MRNVIKILVVSFIFSLAVSANFVFAFSTPTNIYNQPTSLKVSTQSNHKFVITTSVAIPESDTITIAFPSGFDLTSITEDDVDISDDAVDLTTASDCLGSDQVGFSVSSQNLVFEICSGDSGAIATSSEIVIEIGTNASLYGLGSNRITNPSNPATYFIWLSTATNDLSGSIPMPVVADDDGDIGTTISDTSSGGSGGGSGGSDPVSDESDDEEAEDEETEEAEEDADEDDEDTSEEEDEDDAQDEQSEETNSDDTSESSDEDSSQDDDSQEGSSPSSEDVSEESDTDTDASSGDVEEHEIETQITVGNGQILIDEDNLLSGTYAEVQVSVGDLEDVEAVVIVVGDTTYGFAEVTDGVYKGLIPVEDNSQTVTVIVDYKNGDTVTEIQQWGIVDYGWVYEDIDGADYAVADVVIIIYEGSNADSVQWDGANYGQTNPIISNSNGAFAFYVPNGIYTVTAGKSGYQDAQIVVKVTNNILAPLMQMQSLEIIVEDEVVESDNIAIESVVGLVAAFNDIREIPEVQAVASVATPVVVAAVIGSAGILSSSFSLFPFLRYLFSSPILFFARRKRRKIGTVFNSITKLPVDLATIRLYSEAGKLLKTAVSDKSGNYIIRMKAGRYQLDVKKTGFTFPSNYMSGRDSDEIYEEIYTSGIIEVKEDDVVIAVNIPVDPSQDYKFHSPKRLIFKRFLRIFQNIFASIGIIVAIIILIIQPTILSATLVLAHVLIYSVTKALTKLRKKKGWGIVRDVKIKKALSNTIVRLFEPRFNKLIESTITDGAGRYAFMAGPNEYYMTFERSGYEKQEVRPIDFKGNKEPELISVDTSLKKEV